jgi:hypothetical protein
MAMILLIVLAVACAVATFMESGFSNKIAQYYVYHHPWFLGWLAFLCLNLFCVTLTRWPWQKKHYGFVITHYGIITLLVGAVVGRLAGFEGFMTIEQSDEPHRRVVMQQSVLQMQAPSGNIYATTLPVEVSAPRPDRPRQFSIPETSYTLKIDDHSPALLVRESVVATDDPAAPPGVQLKFHSHLLNQTVPMVLSAGEKTAKQDFFGLATIELATTSLPPMPIFKGNPQYVENQMVFALNPLQPITEASRGAPSGVTVQLVNDPATSRFLLTTRTASGLTAQWPIEDLRLQPRSVPGTALQIEAIDFWPHFAIQAGRPISLSEEPMNPALLVRLKPVTPSAGGVRPTLRLYPTTSGALAYQLARGWTVAGQGTLTNEALALGWADWTVTVDRYAPQARVLSQVEKWDSKMNATIPQDARPGVKAQLVDPAGRAGQSQWVFSGMSQNLVLGTTVIPVGFGLQTKPLPFSVALEKFSVPRYEGTESPMNYISTLRFSDPEGQNVLVAEAKMNTPASYPGGLWRSALGLNYKFSQASWNPDNLGESTLQILYDPGWPLKWIGSLMITIGIFMLFYLRPPPKLAT